MRAFSTFAALALVSCGTEPEVEPSVQTLSNGVTVEGVLPAGLDADALAEQVPAGGFGVVVDPVTGQTATLTRDADVRARIASGEFDVTSPAVCSDCGDPTCASYLRTIDIEITQISGLSGLDYEVQTVSSFNFASLGSLPGTWTSSVGSPIDVSTLGILTDCAPFGYFFDVVEDVGAPVPVIVFSDDLDSLPSSGASDLATFEAALPVWAFNNTNSNFQVGTGSSSSGAIYSFGDTSATDRALGGVGSNSTGTNRFGFCAANTSGLTWSDLEISFNGEQWRKANKTDQETTTVDVAFGLTTASLRAGDLTNDGLWTAVPALDITSTQADGVASSIDGNTFSTFTFSTIAGTVADGSAVCFRFVDPNDTGSDHGLAVDDIFITAVQN